MTKHHIQKKGGLQPCVREFISFCLLIVVVWSHGVLERQAASQQQFTLTVTKAGAGSGTVTSSPTGITCGTTCAGSFKQGKKVTLKAKADSGSVFKEWGGACSGMGSCSVVMNSDVDVTATFEKKSEQQFTLTVTKAGSGSGR